MNNNLNIGFDIKIECYEFNNMDDISNIEAYINAPVEIITLSLTKNLASNFLFRNKPSIFKVGNYKIKLLFNNGNHLVAILIKAPDTNNIYLVKDFNKVMETIEESFIRIRTLDKLSAFLDYDFESKTEESENGIVDEFDIVEHK